MREGGLRVGIIGDAGSHAGLARRFAPLEALSLGIRLFGNDDVAPRETVEAGDVIVSMFTDDAAFTDAILGNGILASMAVRGLRVLDFSPVAPWTFREAASRLADAGVLLTGASFGQGRRDEAGAVVCVDDDVLEDQELRRLVGSIAASVVPVGGKGNSKVAGLLERHLHAISVAVSAEAVALGEAAGIPPSVLVPLLLKGSGSTAVLKSSLSGMPGGRDAPSEAIRLGLRQSNMLGRRVRHPSWFGAVAADAFRGCGGHGNVREVLPGSNGAQA